MSAKLNKIKVVVPFHNPGKFLDMCVNSVLTQNYDNYEVLFIDDCSTDGSYEKIPACTFKTDEAGNPVYDDKGELVIKDMPGILKATKCKNVVAWRSSSRITALPNIHNGITNFCKNPDDIVVLCDGDDWLLGKNVLSYINDFYNQNDCWMMYGSSKWTDGRPCCSRPYSKEEFENLRNAPFKVSHIRTFRAGLYHQIGKQDSELKCFKEEKDGSWYKKTYDVAIFFPLMEMTPFDKIKHNTKSLYIYNRDNPINDDKDGGQYDQTRIHMEIMKKPPFKKISDYKVVDVVQS